VIPTCSSPVDVSPGLELFPQGLPSATPAAMIIA